ncbi:NAD(P)/FAD-dependent oxidoreductase [Amycolatopsis sp. FDAARGOS 1241]|uniref:FAD-dependent oxidoreductase n=1 Tax=Amycolatopsis sp. FDAARGOS 1241 TaxID=2778070 RepID=UPI00194E7581|nr:NAD(P)/FAD-dependent oxidoreductase [Amycolatopsis sp. FDAARGOS 1241]QRP50326.1 FAD-dependent monooxygenase [Amycolatopsis sp. FDAARGOS 1241]
MTGKVTTALIIGGGIAGPVAAMALQRAGIEAVVHEAHERTADGVGAGLSIAPNGRRALEVLDAGHIVDDIGVPMTSMVLRSGTGKRLATFPVEGARTVARAELYRNIYDEATSRGIRYEHGKRLVRAEQDPDGVTAYFADGAGARADVLIGADGIRSTVRTQLDPNAPEPSFVGLNSAGGWARDTGLPSTHGETHMVFGKHAFFGYQVFDDGDALWWINLPSAEPLTVAQMKQTPNAEWLRRFRELAAADNSAVPSIIDAVAPRELVLTAASEYLPHVPTWHRGRIALIGDAAHAPSSSSGQGASLSLEDAVEVARCLRDLPTADEAFAAFESLRRPRIDRVMKDTERTNNRKTASAFGRVLRDLLFPVAMKLFAKPEKAAWLTGHEIGWNAPVTAVPVAV